MPMIPLGLQSALWGGFAGVALLVGAGIGYYCKLNQRVVAGVMAFGSGVLISALTFELVEDAFNKGGLVPTVTGFVLGALIYSGANYLVSKAGAKHRKRSNLNNKLCQDECSSNSVSIAIGALIDGIPESIVIGLGMIEGGVVSLVTVAAIFISNIPEGLSSAAGMKKNGKSIKYVLYLWGGIALVSPIFAAIGYSLFKGVDINIIAVIIAIAAGAILTMIVDTMIPEAFEETHNFAGLITVLGFLCAYVLDKI